MKRLSIREWAEIFPEAREVIKDCIAETEEKIEDAKSRIMQSYSHSKRVPEADPICTAVAEIINEEELIPLCQRHRRLCWEYEVLSRRKKGERELIDVEGLKQCIDCRILVESYGIKLRKINSRYSMGLCPFHSEKTPSFAVYCQNFYCYGCAEGGSVIDLVMKLDNIDFLDAIKKLNKF